MFPKKTRLGNIGVFHNLNIYIVFVGVCNTCTKLRTQKIFAKNTAEKIAVKRAMREHTSLHRSDRRVFYARREMSRLSPQVQWSILSDSTSGYVFA